MNKSDDTFSHAQLLFDERGQPLSDSFGDVYFSRDNGLAETRHVFLQYNQLAERFAALSPAATFTVAETGFGTGLNFLAAWQLWREHAPNSARLHFISVEKFPLTRTDLALALALWPELDDLSRHLLTHYPAMTGVATHRLQLSSRVNLTLIIDDATTALTQLARHQALKVDAWFLDGFAPAKNPAMWTDELFTSIGHLSSLHTTAATFSAAGIVKRGLRAAGFDVKRVPGFGRKREMVWAQMSAVPDLPIARPAPAYTRQAGTHQGKLSAVVIGSGIAGSLSARALAERGWQVTVIDRAAEIASAASGNPQGLVYAKLSHRQDTLPAFNLAALQFAERYYRPLWQDPLRPATAGEATGLLQLALDAKATNHYPAVVAALGHPDTLVRWVNTSEASALAGVDLPCGGLYFPASGWLNPRYLCQRQLDHPGISLQLGCEATTLTRTDNYWQVRDLHQQLIAEAAIVVVACAEHTRRLAALAHLPLKPVRGQITYLAANATSEKLRVALCGSGYLAPAAAGHHCLGASFNLHETTSAQRHEDHLANMQHLQDFGPALATSFSTTAGDINGRVAFRCTTPDYLPITGPAPDTDAWRRDFASLAKNAKAVPAINPVYLPGLYVNCGLGSRGLAYGPLCAELLASLITGEPLPTDPMLASALHPGRFIIRDIIRSQ
ncbi:MAG TPA: bifunctional tRNA (5-methylaminomethyl-2-thiouridine)(34)-methyltransferase MnmD/FAD-dependent 5-carboxymethylaminomethyl-2-thiouridine(34) oxidoreductase MnmC [Cellvibrionaceae bacterium]